MKKILIAILCITMMLFGMSVSSFASDKPVFTVGRGYGTSGEVDVPVYITGIPESVENIMAIDFKYSYDTNMLEYVKTTPGTASGNLFTSADGEVHWADATNISEATPKVNADTIGKDNPLFVITFNIIGSGSNYTNIVAEKVSLSSGNLQPGDVFEIIKLSGNYYDIVSGRVVYKDASDAGEETPGGSDDSGNEDDNTDDTTGDGNTSDGENTGDTGEDDTTGDNTEDDGTTGEDNEGDTTETPDDKEDTSDDGNTGGGNTGGLKPNTGGTTGGNTSGSKPSGNTGFGGGIAVIPQTPAETEDDTAKPTKASEVFSDVADDHWAAQYALVLYNNGIVSGDSSKRANLENQITREETSKLALLVNGIDADTALALDVTDAASVSDWAKSFMATAIKEGIFSGYEDGTVRPLNQITREEMVTVIIKSLKLDVDSEATVSFADGSKITWSAPYVAKAVELGFVNGYSDNTFKPENPITRAEAFTIFARVLEYKNK